jgi:hypothetical protein
MSGLFGGGDDQQAALQKQIAAQNAQQQEELTRERAQQERLKAQNRQQQIEALRGRFGGMQQTSEADAAAPLPSTNQADTTSSASNLFAKLTGRLSEFL